MMSKPAKICSVALLLSACGQLDESDSPELTKSIARTLLVTPTSGVTPSQLDTRPPAYTVALASAKGGVQDAAYVQAAQTFAATNASRYALAAGAPGLEAVSVKSSLLGVHVTLQERVNGIPVAAATFTVSFESGSGKVYRVHSAVFPHRATSASKSTKTDDEAYDIAWRHLGVSGDLRSAPRSTLTYVPDGAAGGLLRLVHRIDLDVSAPSGAWQVDVDAVTGVVVAVEDKRLQRYKTASPLRVAPTGPLADRRAAFARMLARESEAASAAKALATTVNGSGKIFDPDPVTTLQDTSLTDGSPASAFTSAYQTVTLQQIGLTAGVYKLEGPWVRIVDFAAPNTAPSTTTTGTWTSKRGNNGFNDVMTYFHVDRSQRYIQSLGFTNIQAAPIQADSDGADGDDQSYFTPPNQLEFGHGAVDDNEDADVILHEYGHAINHGINNSWGGGDMGAMGEGFGDYWAASNNVDAFPANFDNAKVFTWDANKDWAGRRLDLTSLVYDPNQTYGGHVAIPGGSADELWSTPLFQALLALRAAGVSKAQVDTIILEAQYGFGASATMRQMATAIVDTARKLYPMGPHAGILSTKFFAQNILLASDWNLFSALFGITQ